MKTQFLLIKASLILLWAALAVPAFSRGVLDGGGPRSITDTACKNADGETVVALMTTRLPEQRLAKVTIPSLEPAVFLPVFKVPMRVAQKIAVYASDDGQFSLTINEEKPVDGSNRYPALLEVTINGEKLAPQQVFCRLPVTDGGTIQE